MVKVQYTTLPLRWMAFNESIDYRKQLIPNIRIDLRLICYKINRFSNKYF